MVSSSSFILPSQTIKALLDSGKLSSLPTQYASRKHNSDHLEPTVDGDIPVIDISLLSSEDPYERQCAVENLGKACKEWGFFMVVNHGVPESLRESMIEAVARFFGMPEVEKGEYAAIHVSDPIRYGTSFNTSVEDVRYWRDYLKTIVHPEFHCPSKPPGLRDVALEYTTKVRKLAMELLQGICESLGLQEDYMKKTLDLDECFQVLIANLYPPCPQPELAIGIPTHSDHGLLTILMQNDVHGLQVMHDGKWVRVKPLPNSFLVNTGDHTEIITNGRYKSVVHRGVVNNTSARISVATAIGPSLATSVAPASPLLYDEHIAYRAITYKEYFEMQQSNKLDSKSCLDRLRL